MVLMHEARTRPRGAAAHEDSDVAKARGCGGVGLVCCRVGGVTCEGTAMKSGLGTSPKSFCIISPCYQVQHGARLQLTKERQHLTIRKKVRWCRAIPFRHFPEENVIFKNARISIRIATTRVFWKYPRARQSCPQTEKLVFLETWKRNWGSAKATNHCGTFMCVGSHSTLPSVRRTSLTANSHGGSGCT